MRILVSMNPDATRIARDTANAGTELRAHRCKQKHPKRSACLTLRIVRKPRPSKRGHEANLLTYILGSTSTIGAILHSRQA